MVRPHAAHRAWFALVIFAVTLPLAARVSAQPAHSGRGGVAASSRVVGIIVKLQDDPVVSYRGTLPGLAATSRDTLTVEHRGPWVTTVAARRRRHDSLE